MSRSQFDAELVQFHLLLDTLQAGIGNLITSLDKRDVTGFFGASGRVFTYLGSLTDFLNKYDAFFATLDTTFGWDTVPRVKRAKSALGSLNTSLSQLNMSVSEKQYESADSQKKCFSQSAAEFLEEASFIASIPAKIDYSRLGREAWKMIGIPGVHYESRVFLSYPWRSTNPAKDKNESMMNDFVKPLLRLLDIEPVTLRDRSLPQDSIDEKAIQLIRDCDGVIAFYTKRDRVRNVEHEISQNPNLVAICNENGTSGPSMRRGRLQIDFSRDDMSVVIIGLVKALKEKGLFRLVV